MPSFGDEFRAAREARNLSLSDVSEQIHIRSVYLQSIEDEDWSEISAPVYTRGFIRTYARFLGLDSEQAVDQFNAALPEGPGASYGAGMTYAGAARGPSPWLWVAAVAALLLVLFVGYNYYQLQNGDKSGPVAAASPSPAGSAAAAAVPTAVASDAPAVAATPIASGTVPVAGSSAAPAPSASPIADKAAHRLDLKVTHTSWLRVVEDGTVVQEGELPAGTAKTYHGKTVVVRAGNAGGVEASVNGRDVGALGAPGAVVDRSFDL